MNPLAAVAGLVLSVFSLAAPAPRPASGMSPRTLEEAQSIARGAYLTHEPGQLTLDATMKLPVPKDAATAQALELLKTVFEAATDVQLGCPAPCSSAADIQVYSGKIELTARRLSLPEAEVQAALKHYFPDGKPRLRGAFAAQKPGAQAMEAEVVARLLASEQLAPQLRASLSKKALFMAEALGHSQLIPDSNGVVVLPDGSRARMSAAQLAQLNAIPQTQAQILRKLAAAPPPSPSQDEKQASALAAAQKEIDEHPGTVGEAYNYWKGEAENKSNSAFWRAYAKTNMGLLTFSGLKSVEESSQRLGWVWDNPDVSKGEKFWLGTKLAGNAALTAVSFLPAASFAKSIQAGEGFYWIGKAGTAVPGLARAATPEVAQAMNAGSRAVTAVIVDTLPQGMKVGAPELRGLVAGLNAKLGRYGMTIVEGGTAGESVAKGGTIYVSLKAGAQHEMVHVIQQTYTRVMALEQLAARSGTTVEALSQAQRAEAFANAAKWETASYAQLEGQAFNATGFMGSSGGAAYAQQLAVTGAQVSAGMKDAVVLEAAFGPGATVYARLTQILGHSQLQIGTGVAAVYTGAMQTPIGTNLAGAIESVVVESGATAAPKKQ